MRAECDGSSRKECDLFDGLCKISLDGGFRLAGAGEAPGDARVAVVQEQPVEQVLEEPGRPKQQLLVGV